MQSMLMQSFVADKSSQICLEAVIDSFVRKVGLRSRQLECFSTSCCLVFIYICCCRCAEDSITFTATVRPSRNYPLDVYYLMDHSFSMRDDLDIMKTFASSIGTYFDSPVFVFVFSSNIYVLLLAVGRHDWFNRLFIPNSLFHASRIFTIRLSTPNTMWYDVWGTAPVMVPLWMPKQAKASCLLPYCCRSIHSSGQAFVTLRRWFRASVTSFLLSFIPSFLLSFLTSWLLDFLTSWLRTIVYQFPIVEAIYACLCVCVCVFIFLGVCVCFCASCGLSSLCYWWPDIQFQTWIRLVCGQTHDAVCFDRRSEVREDMIAALIVLSTTIPIPSSVIYL